jgi:hypothetical protein
MRVTPTTATLATDHGAAAARHAELGASRASEKKFKLVCKIRRTTAL